jgi:uncharacterized protein
MKNTLLIIIGGLALNSLISSASTKDEIYMSIEDFPIKEVPFTQVHLNDCFWTPRIDINRTVTIPSAFKECEKNGRLDNFAIAGGLMKGEHNGDFPFDDTDVYKAIEGASYSLSIKYDKKLDAYLDSVINLISKAQESDGYLTTCVTNKCYRLSGWWGTHKWEKINSHELYNCGHLYEAAIAHFHATGKRTLLNVAIKNADLVCKVFGPNVGQKHVPSGHPIVEMALCKLYKITGNKKYLNTAKYFVEETGRGTDGHKLSQYSQDYEPILQQNEILGHAVRAGYLYSGVTDVAVLTEDQGYLDAVKRIWNNLVSKKLYITGGMGSRAEGEGFGPNYELNNHTAYCETCASIANVFWSYRMFLATGDAKYMDVVERAMYNGVVSGISLSGNKFFYDNPLESMGEHNREKWFGCACCPGSITRFTPSVSNYEYATQNNDVFVNLYIQGKADIKTESDSLTIEQTTQYPWDGNIKLRINPKVSQPFNIKLRIPGWAQNVPVPSDLYTFADATDAYIIKVNGEDVVPQLENGYANIMREWKAGDVIELSLPMNVRRVKANDSVEVDKGRIALERGPIVYCLEGKDQADSTVFNKIVSLKGTIDAQYNPNLLNGIVTLKGRAESIGKSGIVRDEEFTAIPYYAWDNRGADQMEVWIADNKQSARPTPKPTIASKAQAFTLEQAPIQQGASIKDADRLTPAWGVNDQWEPKRSSDISEPYFYWWLKDGTIESLIYKFDKPYKVSNVQVYWLDFDQYDGNFRVPKSWKLYYKNRYEQWKEVNALNGYGTKKDCYNILNFKPVKTTELKISAQLQLGESGGIIEWKVK